MVIGAKFSNLKYGQNNFTWCCPKHMGHVQTKKQQAHAFGVRAHRHAKCSAPPGNVGFCPGPPPARWCPASGLGATHWVPAGQGCLSTPWGKFWLLWHHLVCPCLGARGLGGVCRVKNRENLRGFHPYGGRGLPPWPPSCTAGCPCTPWALGCHHGPWGQSLWRTRTSPGLRPNAIYKSKKWEK